MKKLSYILLLLLPTVLVAQTTTENYVKKTNYKAKTKNGTYDAVSGATLTNDQKQEQVVYLDGIGRTKQTISLRSGANREDIILHHQYDGFGRQTKDFLPYANGTNNMGIRTGNLEYATQSFYQNKYPDDFLSLATSQVNAYSEKAFEDSPLNRVTHQAAPGKDWKMGGGHEIRFEYQTNTENEVLQFGVSFPTGDTKAPKFGLADSYYPAGSLYKTITKDENWRVLDKKDKTSEEFKNKQGQVVLKRTYNNQQSHDTYYLYDDYGNLTYVLPPLASETTNVYEVGLHTYSARAFVNGGNPTGSVKFGVRKTAPGTFEYYADFDLHNLGNSTFKTGAIMDLPKLHNSMGSHIYLGGAYVNDNSQGYAVKYVNYYIRDGKLYCYPGAYSYGGGNPNSLTITDVDRTRSIALPKNLAGFSEADTQTKVNELLEKLCYEYRYDNYNRLIEKKIAGKGWEYIVYDNLDRPVLTQDANLREENKWLFTKYDALGRVIYTGIYTSNTSRDGLQTTFNNKIATENYETKVSSGTGYAGSYYTNSDFPSADIEILTINYYDDYSKGLPSGFSAPSNVYGVVPTSKTKGLPTISKTRVLGTNNWITNVTMYDKKARPMYVYSKNEYLGTVDILASKLDFTGKTLEMRSTHKKTGKTDIVTVDKYTYDHADRLLTHKQKIGNQPEELIANNQYDELGQLVKKAVGDTESVPLQEVDFSYNVRGWLKKINDPDNGLGTDLFSMRLNYNDDNGQRLYNGNISQTKWKTANDKASRYYYYSYDDLNRIIRSNYRAWSENSRFDASYTYDSNGNLQRLYRRGAIVENPDVKNAAHYGTMDYLNYRYDGNQLLDVTDNGNDTYGFKDDANIPVNDYDYDLNGNMKRDINKGISKIEYNHLNLPTRILSTPQKKAIDYIYDATGQKLEKKYSGYGMSNVITQYAGNYVYENGELQFFGTAEGYATPNNDGNFDYIYQYKDHLGNVRLSYKENTDPSRIETIFDDGFVDTMGEWVANGSSSPSLTNGWVRVNVNSPWEGLRNQLQNLEVTPGEKYTVNIKFNKANTLSNIRFYVQEFDANGAHLRWKGLSWNLQTGEHSYNYTVGANTKKIYLRIDKHNTHTSTETQFYVDNVTLIKGQAQTIFSDGFDSMTGWDRSENAFGHSLSALDSSKKRSGSYSGRIDSNYPADWSRYVFSDVWTPVNNSEDTYYTVSGWAFLENVTDNEARMFLMTRKAGETGYPSGAYSTSITTEKGKWVFLERSVKVPADVKELNVRIDNNKGGKVWFEDVKIVKGNSAKTTIVEEKNYYVFGLQHKGYNNVVSSNGNSTAQKFGYNGKELSEELGINWHDFDARNYDASLGRWMNIDNFSEVYFSYSPYNYALNTPTNAIDPDGNLVIFINGQHTGSGAKGYQNGGSNWRGTRNYWKGDDGTAFDVRVMGHLNDYNAIYRDGSMGGFAKTFFNGGNLWSNSRRIGGYQQGKLDAKRIIEAISDSDGNIVETLKIISHSMGGAYAKGYVKAILEYAKKNNIEGLIIEFEADFASFQPKSQKAVKAKNMGPTLQYSHDKDYVAGNKPIDGAEQQDTSDDEDQGHSILSFLNQIAKLPTGKYKVENGKIIPVEEKKKKN